ncbi:MAG TPA: symmetrical bis(5'-nucleosyl)-tetraphosphatase [Thiothrix sp.]|nr:symmetrical bis(5'-nucleosyl)-tetraphosphatase [Thiothrix sp.]
MATYVLGDIQGCYAALCALVEKLNFDANRDQLWFVGDLVNRGGYSLATLRFLYALGDAAVSVLGNHDLHLLACYYAKRATNDELQAILNAPDADELMNWLRHRPLLHIDQRLKLAMVHAGISPQWDLATAQEAATDLEYALQQDECLLGDWFAQIYGNTPSRWSATLTGHTKQRYSINALTRMRYCTAAGTLDFACKVAPDTMNHTAASVLTTPPTHTMQHLNGLSLYPWFRVPSRKPLGIDVVFGHWSSLGWYHATHLGDDIIGIDTGCVWGNRLTAIRVDLPVKEVISIQCDNYGK